MMLPSGGNCRCRSVVLGGVLAGFLASGLGAETLELEGWTSFESANFRVYSNADTERAIDLVHSLERFRAAFAQLAPELELRSPVPTRMLAFRDEESYAPFKSGRDRAGARILGQFLGHRDGNFITLNADPRFLGGLGVVYHEYVHYFVQHNLPTVPRWFNEGLAEYYSTFATDGEAAVVGLPVDRHVQWIRTHDDLGLSKLIRSGNEPGELHRDRKAGQFYAVSWGLVHYLFSSDIERAGQLAEFFERSARGADPVEAFETALELRVGDLEEELKKYFLGANLPAARVALDRLESSIAVEARKTAPADLLSLFGDLVVGQGLERRAETFYNLALDHDPGHAEAHAGLAYVRDLQSRLEEAEILYREALEFGPNDARTYLLYGRHLLARLPQARAEGGSEAATRLAEAARLAFAQAAGLDPEFAETHAMLGYSHLFAPGDASRGIAPLEKARKLLPGRADVVFHLLQLHLKLGHFDRARSLASGELARIGGEEMVYRANEEIERASLIRAANEALQQGRHEEGLRFLDRAIAVTSDPQVRAELERELLGLETKLER